MRAQAGSCGVGGVIDAAFALTSLPFLPITNHALLTMNLPRVAKLHPSLTPHKLIKVRRQPCPWPPRPQPELLARPR
jgi:hypothetical protein